MTSTTTSPAFPPTFAQAESAHPSPGRQTTQAGPAPAGVLAVGREHIPALDGLRAIAVLSVLRVHAIGVNVFPSLDSVWGCRGVSLFFILSGFLITRILLAERRRGRVDLVRFYAHRTGRIVPLYAAMVGLLMAVYGWRWETWSSAAYVYNFALMGRGPSPIPNGAFWSLCVEEHFYLVWPLVVAILPLAWSRRTALGMAVGGLVVAGLLCWRFGVAIDGSLYMLRAMVYHNTLTQMAPLAIGCLLAYAEADLRQHPRRLLGMAVGALAVFYAAGPVITWRFGDAAAYYGELVAHLENTSLALAWFAIVLWGAFTGRGWRPLDALLTDPRLAYIGRISYGLYLLHAPFYHWISPATPGAGYVATMLRNALALAVVFALAALSNRYFETPIREWVKAWVKRRA